VTVTTQAAPPPATLPTNVVVGYSGYFALEVSWTANGGATTHRVQVAYQSDTAYASPLYDVNDTSNPRLAFGLASNTSYRVRVSADNGATWSVNAFGSTPYYDDGGGVGGWDCILEDNKLTVVSVNDNVYETEIKNVSKGDRILGSHAGRRELIPAFVTQVKRVTINELLTITTEKGNKVDCSKSHRIITSYDDVKGTHANLLEIGDKVLVYDKINNQIVEDFIAQKIERVGEFKIIKLSLDSEDHTYIGEGILAHNRKYDP
jgi:hypothetical protein